MMFGITGTNVSGKSTVVEILKAEGFTHLSVREYLNQELNKYGLPQTIENLQNIANKLRYDNNDPAYIVRTIYEHAKSNGDLVIESLRCPGEIIFLKKLPQVILLGIDADPEKRYERAIKRARERKALTDLEMDYSTFLEYDIQEKSSGGSFRQNISVCMSLIDLLILNNSSKENLVSRVRKMVNSLR